LGLYLAFAVFRNFTSIIYWNSRLSTYRRLFVCFLSLFMRFINRFVWQSFDFIKNDFAFWVREEAIGFEANIVRALARTLYINCVSRADFGKKIIKNTYLF
jgi:hypothetical protein